MPQTITFKQFRDRPILEKHLGLGGKDSKNGHSIGVNSRYLTFDGKPWIPVMGEYHFSRDTQDQWSDKLMAMKEGGISVISTYLFWIYHEEEEGVFRFDGDLDVRKFVTLCHDFGLKVIIRIGPWCHGECRNGGFPDWLIRKNIPLRTNSPEYLKYVRLLYSAYIKQLEGLFFKDGGPIICTQVENELVNNAEHLAELVSIAKDCGFDTPLYTVTGWNNDQGAEIPLTGVLPVFSGYCDAPWSASLQKQSTPSMHYFFLEERNDSAVGADLTVAQQIPGKWHLPYERYPYLTCELGAGLQSTYHRRYIIDPMDIYAISLVKLGCGNNMPGYYVFCGGTNKLGKFSTLQESKATGYPNDYPILNYDYNAPVSEYGERRPHFGLLNMLHMFLKIWGSELAPMLPVFQKQHVSVDDRTTLRCCMRTNGRSGFVFVNHYQRLYPLETVREAVIDTGLGVVFPPIDVHGNIAFFMPFNMTLAGCSLTYATAQPIFRKDNTFFFAAIPGIQPEFRFEDGSVMHADPGFSSRFTHKASQIVTLTWDNARFLRTCGEDLFAGEWQEVTTFLKDGLYRGFDDMPAVETKQYGYVALDAVDCIVHRWNGECFESGLSRFPGQFAAKCAVKTKTLSSPPFHIPEEYAAVLQLGGKRDIIWKKLLVKPGNTYVEIMDVFDVAQLYVDGKLVADKFYDGIPWRFPAGMFAGHECYLAMTPWKDGVCYHEIPKRQPK